jgi:hypothetical protein
MCFYVKSSIFLCDKIPKRKLLKISNSIFQLIDSQHIARFEIWNLKFGILLMYGKAVGLDSKYRTES